MPSYQHTSSRSRHKGWGLRDLISTALDIDPDHYHGLDGKRLERILLALIGSVLWSLAFLFGFWILRLEQNAANLEWLLVIMWGIPATTNLVTVFVVVKRMRREKRQAELGGFG
jgi:hypothetical protein